MDEFCRTIFHTLLSSTVHRDNSLSKRRINADRWMRPNIQYFQIMHVVIVSVIPLDLLPPFICIQSLHSVCSWLLLSLWQRWRDRQTVRQTEVWKSDSLAVASCTHTDLLFVQSLRIFHSCVYLGPCREYLVAWSGTARVIAHSQIHYLSILLRTAHSGF